MTGLMSSGLVACGDTGQLGYLDRCEALDDDPSPGWRFWASIDRGRASTRARRDGSAWIWTSMFLP